MARMPWLGAHEADRKLAALRAQVAACEFDRGR